MHIILRIHHKQERILTNRLGLKPVARDEETEMTIFEVNEKKKSGRVILRKLQELCSKPLEKLLLPFKDPAQLQIQYKIPSQGIIHFN